MSRNENEAERRAVAGKAWSDAADLIDRQLSPLGLEAIEALAPRPGDDVLDVGCGAGQSTLQLAGRVGLEGKVVGIDISSQLLALARQRATGLRGVEFIEHDASTLALPDAGFDGIYSRFGVMAFTDPVLAFRNLRRMLRPQGTLAFVCWRSLYDNELDVLPLRAAGLEHLLDPTPFSFAELDDIRRVLDQAGFEDIVVRAHDEMVSCGDIEATLKVLLSVGALGRILRENPDLRPEAERRVRAALSQGHRGDGIALNAAVWIVTATR